MTMSAASDARAVLESPPDRPASADEVVRAAMEWHFSPGTGARFWLERAHSLPFDPREDVRTVADLALFPDVSAEWRDVPVEDLVPRGCQDLGEVPKVWESGGTTGAPKRIVEIGLDHHALDWASSLLDGHGFPAEGHWLHIGPTGPHFVAQDQREFARRRGGALFCVDLDPRWVKRCIREGRSEEAGRYVDHLLGQAEEVLRSQRVTAMLCTPPLLEAIADRPMLADLVRSKIRGIVWGGASMTKETRRLLTSEVFPGITLVGVYGNTLMGRAPQRPGVPAETEDCVFQPYHPFVHLAVVDPGTGEQVGYGSRGQVRMTRLSRDVLLPNVLERDDAVRVAPVPGHPGDAVADVLPLRASAGSEIVEGVY